MDETNTWTQLGRYRYIRTLPGGERLLLRPLAKSDEQGLVDLFSRASPEDLAYFRDDAGDPAVVRSWVQSLDLKKVYPLAPRPPVIDADSIRILYPNGEDTLFLTEDGFIRYYEYEFTLQHLLPSVTYWINVTAFDFGSPKTGLSAMETNPATNPKTTMAMDSPDWEGSEKPEVYVYPNPYRIDVDYRARGFEGRGYLDKSVDRTRRSGPRRHVS